MTLPLLSSAYTTFSIYGIIYRCRGPAHAFHPITDRHDISTIKDKPINHSEVDIIMEFISQLKKLHHKNKELIYPVYFTIEKNMCIIHSLVLNSFITVTWLRL